jgi:two-component system, OmpR family, copper resistance phosphate regulon response regulator CusR
MSGATETIAAPQILVVEDEVKVAGALRQGLEAEGFLVRVANTGEDGFYLASSERFELMILDRMLPGRDGLEILQALRKKGFLTPVLVLTARDGIDERVQGLDAGADDYLVKPFAFAELLARVRALVRRSRGDQLVRLSIADLVVDVTTRTVSRDGRRIDLTSREFELLAYLVRHRGTLVSREMLARDVWGETERCTPLDNVIDVHMARLRKKVDTDDVRLIHTVRGVGFIVRERDE